MAELYLENPYLKSLETKVSESRQIENIPAISLENNIFYPGGGGQPSDKGVICIGFGNGEIQISKVLKIGGKIFLCLPDLKKARAGEAINAKIDWDLRYRYMRCHTAAHLVNGAIKRNAENYNPLGINISEGGLSVTVKFDGTWAQNEAAALKFIEIANELIQKNAEITVKSYKNISEAVLEYGEIYRGTKNLTGKVRIVMISNWDANPCGGTHVRNLKEIGKIRLTGFEKQGITFSLDEPGIKSGGFL